MVLLSPLEKRLSFPIFRTQACKKLKHHSKQLDVVFLFLFYLILNSAELMASFLVQEVICILRDLQGIIFFFFFLSCASNMVFISDVEEESKHLVNCLQASIKVVSTFVELEQTVKQDGSAAEHSSFCPLGFRRVGRARLKPAHLPLQIKTQKWPGKESLQGVLSHTKTHRSVLLWKGNILGLLPAIQHMGSYQDTCLSQVHSAHSHSLGTLYSGRSQCTNLGCFPAHSSDRGTRLCWVTELFCHIPYIP